MKKGLLFLSVLLILSGCSLPIGGDRGCPPNTMINWIDSVKINDIQYFALDQENYQVKEGDIGKTIGEVSYRMADKACSDHKMRNGDAAFLDVETEIHEFAGYKTDFRVIADGTVYQVEHNEQAKTIADLYDIKRKVAGMSLRSSYDGSYVMDLKEGHSEQFMEAFLALDYVGFDEVYSKIGDDEDRVFLDIHLIDGSSISIVYWVEANIVNPGAIGNEKMQEIIGLYR